MELMESRWFILMVNLAALLPFLAVLAFWAYICYRKIKKWADQAKRCSLKLEAQVVEVQTRLPRELHMRGTSLFYKPTLKVLFNNQEYRITSAPYTSLMPFESGQLMEISVNPDDFQDFIFEGLYGSVLKILDIGICLLGLAALAVCILVMVL